MKIYYLHDGKQQFGPFDLEELKNQPVTSSTMVWKQGMEKWAKASAVPELAEILKSAPPPLEKKNFGTDALHKAKEVLNKDFVQEIEQKIPNNTAKRTFKIAVLIFAILGISFTVIYFWPRKAGSNPQGDIKTSSADYYYYKNSTEMEGYIYGDIKNFAENISYRDVKFHIKYFANDGKTLCSEEDLVYSGEPITPKEAKHIKIPIPAAELPKPCTKVKWTVVDATPIEVENGE